MMKYLVLISILALVSARPETYREKEDFQYSRSSTDEGSKAGSYGAQRGNMGGNYERAHNMDSLAQHQMSSLVRQVDGELGPGANTNTGSVYTAGNSRGVFGSGHYDLSNLKGRNFGEGTSYDDSQSSRYSQGSRYRGNSFSSGNTRQQSQISRQNLGYQTAGQSESYMATDNQRADNLQHSNINQQYDSQADRDFKYYGQAGAHGSTYDQSVIDSHGSSASNIQTRLVSATPLRIYVRPGTRVTIPVAAQTYDASHLDSVQSQNNLNSESELLTNDGSGTNYKPGNNGKHYESSYSYRKEWEKHDTQPLIVTPTENPFPKNSELYDSNAKLELQNSKFNQNSIDMNSIQSSNQNQAYSKSSSTKESRYNSGYNAETHNTAAGSHSNDYTLGTQTGNLNSDNILENSNAKPKSYQSSYSYHKSWERQGDPYVIVPATKDSYAQSNQEFSKRLTAASENYGQQSSHHYGSHQNFGSHSSSQNGNLDCDCDENGHIRVPRSYNSNDYQDLQQQQEDLTQQTQGNWENLDNLDQQMEQKFDQHQTLDQHSRSEYDLSQQTYNNLYNMETFNQATLYHPEKLEDLQQQSESKWHNLEDVRQQSYNKWNNMEPQDKEIQNHPKQTTDLGQQNERKWDDLEDMGQQNYNKWDNMGILNQRNQNHPQKLEELGQQTENNWDNLDNLGQQSYNKWDNMETSDQQTQNHPTNLVDLGQQSEDLEQQNYNNWDNMGLNQQNQNHPQKLEELGQQTENKWDKLEDLGQQSYNKWDNMETVAQHTQNHPTNLGQQSKDLEQQNYNKWDNMETSLQQSENDSQKLEDLGQQTENKHVNVNNLVSQDQATQIHWSKDYESQQNQSKMNNLDILGDKTQNNSNFNSKDTQSGIENQEQLNKNHITSYNKQQHDNLAKEAEQQQNTFDDLQNSHINYQNQSEAHSNFNENKTKTLSAMNNDEYTNFWDQFDFSGNTTQRDDEKNRMNDESSHIIVTEETTQKDLLINNIWSKLDENLGEAQVQTSSINKYNFSRTYNSNEYWNHHYVNSWKTDQNTNIQNLFDFNSPQENVQSVEENFNIFHPADKNININTDQINPKNSSNHLPHPIDVGRGDIESEDVSGENTQYETLNLIQQEKQQDTAHHDNVSKHNILPYDQDITNESEKEMAQFNFHQGNINKNRIETTDLLISPTEKIGKENVEQVSSLKPHRDTDQQGIIHHVENTDQQYQNVDTQSLLDFDQHTQMLEHMPETQQLQQFGDSFIYEHKNYQQHQNVDTFTGYDSFPPTNNKEQFELHQESNKKTDDNIEKNNLENKNQPLVSLEPNQFNKHDTVDVPPELVTEKPGFWKSVGNKLSNAKESVISWFKS